MTEGVAPIKTDNGEITGAVLLSSRYYQSNRRSHLQLLLEVSSWQVQIEELQRFVLKMTSEHGCPRIAHPLANITTAIQMLKLSWIGKVNCSSSWTWDYTQRLAIPDFADVAVPEACSMIIDLQKAQCRLLTLTIINLQRLASCMYWDLAKSAPRLTKCASWY